MTQDDEFAPGGKESPPGARRLWPELGGADLDRILEDERGTIRTVPRVNVAHVFGSLCAAVRSKAR